MNIFSDKFSGQERRQYIRLDSVISVELRLCSAETNALLTPWLQGLTNNVAKAGLCLVLNNPGEEALDLLRRQKAKVLLKIELPIAREPISLTARPTWLRRLEGEPDRYMLGLVYEGISPAQSQRIMRYARIRQFSAPLAIAVIILLGLGFGVGTYFNYAMIKANKALVSQLVAIVQESSIAKQEIKQIFREKEALELKIQALQSRIETVEAERSSLKEQALLKEALASSKIKELNLLIEELGGQQLALKEELSTLQQKESLVTESLLRLDKKKAVLEKASLDKMYQWLSIHQNAHTGLVISFEGDSRIADWAFTYDQSLAIQAYLNSADFKRAKKALEFFRDKAKRQNGLFLNAYYARDGLAAEYLAQAGPNIWLGIAALHYVAKTGEDTYLGLAEEIARSISALQDSDGGIRGSDEARWFSTEHNLDGYAFFNMFHQITGKAQYLRVAESILAWVVKNTYNKQELPIQRGKGDATIATDTYAWSIAAVGPEKLEQIGMNPERIMEFAEENCAVKTLYRRPEGTVVEIKGFDFAPQRHLARGGVVSTEWTAQMIIAFKIMADFYYQKGLKAKAHSYEVKADDYLSSLSNMMISSPSPSGQGEACLPYASQEAVDTGHGWFTPQGQATGSLASTAYMLFAYYKYNPLQLVEERLIAGRRN